MYILNKNTYSYTCVKKKENYYYSMEYDISGIINNHIPLNKNTPVKILSKGNKYIFDISLNIEERNRTIKKNKDFEYAKKKLDYIIYINDINDDIVKKDIIFLYIYNSFISYGNYKTIIKNIIRGKWFIDFGCKDISCELSYYDEVIDNINDSLLETYNMKQFINKRIQSSVLSILEDKRTINVEIQHLDTYKIMYGRNVQDCYLCIIDVVIDGSLYANRK